MGVYIKGMEMPTWCEDCPCFYPEYNECNAIVGRWVDGKATPPSDCPLVPVPPHGDLIDYNFCVKNYELLHDDDGNPVYAVRMRDINAAPTIIPAEEGE